jgi:hypothetical protein
MTTKEEKTQKHHRRHGIEHCFSIGLELSQVIVEFDFELLITQLKEGRCFSPS